jgi:hypothetical protein
VKRIDTIEELRIERIRLRQKKMHLECEIRNDFSALKKSLTPVQLITEGASKMLLSKNHGVLNELVSGFINLILKKGVLKNSGFLIRMLVPLIAKNSANNFLYENKTKILGLLANLILKGGNKPKPAPYDKTTADINF